ncbi:MAG: hypothetical protein GY703_15855 [Gammaproteobacteria bacterium]|nr:hypothetical protein [Gammaproteobacteria bacterium]
MALHLEMRVRSSKSTTLDYLRLDFSLENQTSRALTLPGPYDLTDALTLVIYNTDGEMCRLINGITRQVMSSSGRVDERPDLVDLLPGETWEWFWDTVGYHYPLAAGEYRIQGIYTYQDLRAVSSIEDLVIMAEEVESLVAVRDNPVMDGLTLLIGASLGGESRLLLRQHGYQRPLSAWYSEPLDLNTGAELPFLASPAYFRTDSFEHFFERWLIVPEGGRVEARRYCWGRASGERFQADLPASGRLLRVASCPETGPLKLYFLDENNALRVLNFDRTGLHECYRYPLPHHARSTAPAIRADCDHLHLAIPDHGIYYAMLTHGGDCIVERHLYRTRLLPVQWDINPERRTIHALFRGGRHDRVLELVELGPELDQACCYRLDGLSLRGDIAEIDFAWDDKQRYHLLLSTSRNQLYYLEQGHGPVRIAQGEHRFYPRVVLSSSVYLGCYRKEFGYRFLEFQRQHGRPRIVDYEEV